MRGWSSSGRNENMKKAVVLGLDGTPHSFLETEMEKGNLPALASLRRRGSFARMETEIPAISSVAWASFMTGVNPAEHGIFGFTDRKPGSYDLYFPNYSHLRAKTMWETLSDQGKRCCVINVPSTYPARPLEGILVSGFVAPSLEKATYPASAFDYLLKAGYRIDVDAAKGRESLDALIEDLHETLEQRREAIHHFYKTENWDLFIAVFTGTDRLHHFLWRHYDQEDPLYGGEFIRYYRRLDEIIGEFCAEIPADTALFMLSDHGFCRIEKEIFLNAFLRDEGLLSYASDEPRMLPDIDPSATRFYCMDPGRIYVNLEGREPRGIVGRDEVGALLDELAARLEAIRDPDNGETIADRIVFRDEIYQGPYVEMGPDLVVVPRRGYDLKGSMAHPETIGSGHLTGMHTHDDAFTFVDEGLENPEHIRMLAPMILNSISAG